MVMMVRELAERGKAKSLVTNDKAWQCQAHAECAVAVYHVQIWLRLYTIMRLCIADDLYTVQSVYVSISRLVYAIIQTSSLQHQR